MDPGTKDNSSTAKWRVMVRRRGQMVMFMTANGRTTFSMEPVSSTVPRLARQFLRNGEKARSGLGPIRVTDRVSPHK